MSNRGRNLEDDSKRCTEPVRFEKCTHGPGLAANMKQVKITDEEKAAKAIFECINNADNFLNASVILLDSKKYREALLLALYAGEEIGRVPLIFNYPVHSKTPDALKKWQGRYNDHTEKFALLRNLERTDNKFIPTEINNEDSLLTNKRLEISYINYKNGQFITPIKVSAIEASSFIKKIIIRLKK